MFTYKSLENFTYHIIEDESNITPFLRKWLGKELEQDIKEDPNQSWGKEWLRDLQELTFNLAILDLEEINPRKELMQYETETYNFIKSLQRRAAEREEGILRGVSSEPLTVRERDMELIDGYTRYMVLKKLGVRKVYVYLGK